MKISTVLIAAMLLVSPVLPVAAQTQSAKKKTISGSTTHTRSAKRKPRRTPVTPVKSSRVVTLPSGLTFVITRRGEGRQPLAGERVSVNYTGVMASGIKFDSSLDRGQPYSFALGQGQVIKGWDEGIAKLHVGDQATFVIPPQLAYGERGRGPIPPNATLIFVVELMGIEEKPAAP